MQLLINFHRDMLSWKQSLSTHEWLTAIALMSVLTAVICWLGWRWQLRMRLMTDTPTSQIRSAAQGYVELIGHTRLMDGPPIVAPLSQKPCVWYRYKIEELQDDSKNWQWTTLNEGVSDHLFLLQDATSQCVIDPEGAILNADQRERWQQGSGSERRRYTEHRLSEDMLLYALGHFKTEGHGMAVESIQDRTAAIIREWKNDPDKRAEYDLDGDGELDMNEWSSLRLAARQQAQQALHAETEASLPAMNVLEKPQDSRLQYLLTVDDPDKLIKRYRWYSLSLLTLGTLGVAWLAYVITLSEPL